MKEGKGENSANRPRVIQACLWALPLEFALKRLNYLITYYNLSCTHVACKSEHVHPCHSFI